MQTACSLQDLCLGVPLTKCRIPESAFGQPCVVKRFLLPFLLLFVLAGASSASAADQILVQYDPGVSSTERQEIRGELGLQLEDRFSLVPGLELVSTDDGSTETVRELRSIDGVLLAAPDRIREGQSLPSDPRFSSQWGLLNTGQWILGSSWATKGADIQADEAWDSTLGSRSVRVAVIDFGVDMNHPDLDDNIWTNPGEIAGNKIDDDKNGYVDDVHGWDFADRDNDPSDSTGHGTAVAGVIAAEASNGIGISGVAPNVTLVPLRACSQGCRTSDTIAALEYAVNNGIMISNNSYGGVGAVGPEYQAIKEAAARGHIFVTSAGNESASNDDPAKANYPSSYDIPEVLAVAAHTMNDELASFSNFGQAVDIAAPGETIISTARNGQYSWVDGTSLASPFVAGTVALVRSKRPGFSSEEVIAQVLRGRAPLVGGWSGKTSTGRMLSAARALSVKPLAPVISKSPAAVSTGQASFSFFAESGMLFDCSLDGGAWTPCLSGIRYSGLQPGIHSFRVRSRDSYGLTSDPVAYTWKVSSIAGPGFSALPAFLASASARITLSGTGAITCRVNAGAWQICPSTLLLSGLPAGRNTLEAYLTVDGENSAVTEVSWTVDLDRPTGSAARKAQGRGFLLLLQAADKTSRVSQVEISDRVRKPTAAQAGYVRLAFKPKRVLAGKRVPRWARFIDMAGNRSVWVRVR